eukprot:TRINITY_DN107782_c0_g1_i1.p1 TRINITY_DN107782_c0_g1~~TRINITY_DN107782_c0_g1_i1.p1  ORF type:complete len:299 (-),score=37.96 TRINITY_DN107782_c0_g1_i1:83-979(-)
MQWLSSHFAVDFSGCNGTLAAGGRLVKAMCHQRSDLSESCSVRVRKRGLLSVLAEDEIREILLYLDLPAFALVAAPACRFLSRLINADSFEGWILELQRLLTVCPWKEKATLGTLVESSCDLKSLRYRTALKLLDREFATNGQKIVPETLRGSGTVHLPPFFRCSENTLVYSCKRCNSFLSLVDNTVGRGTMGYQKAAFILQPQPVWPFCCGVQEEREGCLSSGKYILKDLVCPNGNCDANLGWKYQDCVGEGEQVPSSNRRKIGQFWMFAESLNVEYPMSPHQPGCTGEQFYLLVDF